MKKEEREKHMNDMTETLQESSIEVKRRQHVAIHCQSNKTVIVTLNEKNLMWNLFYGPVTESKFPVKLASQFNLTKEAVVKKIKKMSKNT